MLSILCVLHTSILGFGIGKGMLMLKEGISKIQIPKSMLKVQKSRSQHPLHDSVVVIVSELFLSDKSITIGRIFADNPKKQPTASVLRELTEKKTAIMFTTVLLAAGVSEDALNDCRYHSLCYVCWLFQEQRHLL